MTPTKVWIIILSAYFVAPAAQAQLVRRDPTDLKALTLENQFEGQQNVALFHGNVLVIVYGDRKSTDANKYFGEQLQIAFHPTAKGLTATKARQEPVVPIAGLAPGTASPDVITIPAASLGTVPALMRPLIRSHFRTASPEFPIWLDWKDDLKTKFGLSPGLPNVAIIDTQSRLRYTFSGPIDQEKFNQITEAIEALRKEAVKK